MGDLSNRREQESLKLVEESSPTVKRSQHKVEHHLELSFSDAVFSRAGRVLLGHFTSGSTHKVLV